MIVFLRIALYMLFFVSGAVLVQRRYLKQSLASHLLSFIFHFGLPVSVFYALSTVQFEAKYLVLPLSGVLVSVVSGVVAFVYGKYMRVPKKTLGVLVAAAMIMNTGLTAPFMEVVYGVEGLALISLFDIGNLVMAFTVVYVATLHIGGTHTTAKALVERIITMPALWGMGLALALRWVGVVIDAPLLFVMRYVTIGVFLLVMFTLGLLFEFSLSYIKQIFPGLLLRYAVGIALGVLLVWWFKLQGLERVVVLAGAASPHGYTSLVYARMGKLDVKYAAHLVSVSLGIGIVFIPILLLALRS
jgi:malate permease and related proteins